LGLKRNAAGEDGRRVQLNAMVTAVTTRASTIKEKDGGERRIECACKVWAAASRPVGRPARRAVPEIVAICPCEDLTAPVAGRLCLDRVLDQLGG